MLKEIKDNKRQIIIVASLLIFTGLSILVGKIIINIYQDKRDNKKISEYYEINEEVKSISEDEKTKENNPETKEYENYIAILKIPKIGLTKGIYAKESYMNNVNRSIQIIKKSDYPDVDKGNFILAAHSGTARISYFKNLSKLSKDDKALIDYNGKTYTYKLVKSYDLEKTGRIKITRNNDKSTLTLTTCRDKTNKQIVQIYELQSIK